MIFSDEHMRRMDTAAANLAEAEGAEVVDHSRLRAIFQFFKDSETRLLQMLGAAEGQPPESGELEFGAVLYQMEAHLQEAHPILWKIVDRYQKKFGIHASFDPQDFAELFTTGRIGPDGTLWGFSEVARYGQLDPGWLEALFEYIQLKLHIKGRVEPFPHRPAVVKVPSSDTLRIALTADWGSGPWGNGAWGHEDHGKTSPALLVMDQIEKKNQTDPWDFTVHLGDVYYGGTFAEERRNLLPHWVEGSRGSFTLNSNHEMYDGARGYFGVALDPDGPFKAQKRNSYFAIESDDWAIVGLDSAYYDESEMFMDGALVDRKQKKFLAGYKDKSTVIVLTHHNPFTVAGDDLTKNKADQGGLWNNVVDALGRAPDFWYWGHVHNGVAYKTVPDQPASMKNAGGIETKGRCLGHAALPFGNASEVAANLGNVCYYAHTPMPSPVLPYQKYRVLNGWVEVTLGGGQLSEAFVEAGGEDSAQPVWHKTWDLPVK